MIFLYSLALFLLGAAHWCIKRRVALLETKYLRVALAADALARQSQLRTGAGQAPDACQAAKRQYELGQLVHKRDRIESRYATWQSLADRLAYLIGRLRGWKGRTLPYTLGALDVAGALAMMDFLGLGQVVNPRSLVEAVLTLIPHLR